jgi:hypothetical protein
MPAFVFACDDSHVSPLPAPPLGECFQSSRLSIYSAKVFFKSFVAPSR